MKIANHKAHEYTKQRVPFRGSNLFAENAPNGAYVVYSYGRHFPIYAFVDGQWFANKDKYSRSTTRHQSQARPVWEGDKMRWLSTKAMKCLVENGVAGLTKARLLGGIWP